VIGNWSQPDQIGATMAFPRSVSIDAPPTRGRSWTLRFTRRRDVRERHNPNVDAAWWPRSANLTAELDHLLRLARDSGFQATGVAYRLDDGWTAPAGPVVFGPRKVKVSGYHNHHRDMITLIDGISHERLQVMVVPAGTPPVFARRALRFAVVYTEPIHGTDLLALARGETSTAVVTG
jgi:hypothetical protein